MTFLPVLNFELVNKATLCLFFDQLNLEDHLSAVHHYLLLQAPSLMQNFADDLLQLNFSAVHGERLFAAHVQCGIARCFMDYGSSEQ